MIKDQMLNQKNEQKREFYGIEALSNPRLDVDGLRDIKNWLIYKITDSSYQLLELGSHDMLTAKKLYINFSSIAFHLPNDRSVISGDELASALSVLDERNQIEIVEVKKDFVKINLR